MKQNPTMKPARGRETGTTVVTGKLLLPMTVLITTAKISYSTRTHHTMSRGSGAGVTFNTSGRLVIWVDIAAARPARVLKVTNPVPDMPPACIKTLTFDGKRKRERGGVVMM